MGLDGRRDDSLFPLGFVSLSALFCMIHRTRIMNTLSTNNSFIRV